MSTPQKRKGKTVLLTSDVCPKCIPAHLMSDHVIEKGEQCSKCCCVAQDVSGDPRSA